MIQRLIVTAAVVCSILNSAADADAQVVVFDTSLGDITVELFTEDAPISVENFLGYVSRGDYENTILHRSTSEASAGISVVQGGGFDTAINPIPTQDPIANEFSRSNVAGTIAYARLGGDPDSATSQFFFNVTDNTELDTIDGGFTVFGQITSGLNVVTELNALQRIQLSGTPVGTLDDFPLLPTFDGSAVVTPADFVLLNGVSVVGVPEPATVWLVGIGAASLTLFRRRENVAQQSSRRNRGRCIE